MSRLGLYFTKEKREALVRGDTSNLVVDRLFVYMLQAFGVHLCRVPPTAANIRLQANYAQIVMESLIQLNETNQEITKLQALVSAIHASILVGFMASGQLNLLMASKIIAKAKLRFLMEYEPPAELSERVLEDFSVLSQVIYLDNYFYLTSDGSVPVPVQTAGIEREFRFDLQVSRSTLPHRRARDRF